MTPKHFLAELGYPVESKHRILLTITDLCLLLKEYKNHEGNEIKYELKVKNQLIEKI